MAQTTATNRVWRVWDGVTVLMVGTKAQCYEAYPTLALVDDGMRTRCYGLWLEEVAW